MPRSQGLLADLGPMPAFSASHYVPGTAAWHLYSHGGLYRLSLPELLWLCRSQLQSKALFSILLGSFVNRT